MCPRENCSNTLLWTRRASWVRMAMFEKKMQWHDINVPELMESISPNVRLGTQIYYYSISARDLTR